MNNKKYKISYNGECVKDKDIQAVKQDLAKLLKIDFNRVEIFFNGDSIDLKSNIDYETAEKYRKAFEKIGAICTVESIEEKPINNLIETPESNLQNVNEEYQDNNATSEQEFFSFRRYLLNKEKFKQEWTKIYWLIILLSVGLIVSLTVIFQQWKEISNLDYEISNLERKISDLESKVITLNEEKKGLQSELDGCRSEKDSYESLSSDQSSSNESLKNDNGDMESKINDLESNNNELETNNNDLERKISNLEYELSSCNLR